MKIYEVTKALENWAPPVLQESYDNSGLICGDAGWEFRKAIICLDCLEAVVDEAVRDNANLIIAHHPIVFSGIKKLTGSSYIERTLIKAVKHDIAIYALHTNLDHVISGVSFEMATRLGLSDIRILREKSGQLLKLTTFVPAAYQELVRTRLFEAGAGNIGKYDSCSFSAPGSGTFRAGLGANPFVGEIGELHTEEEVRLEVIVAEWKKPAVTKALLESHPYEEVAHDWTRLENSNQQTGSGVIGMLSEPVGHNELLKRIKSVFGGTVRHTIPLKNPIRSVALCGGSGSFLISDAIYAGADVYLTADLKYHQFFDADGKLMLVDIGHFESEQFTMDLILRFLQQNFANFAARLTSVNTNPISYL